MLRPDRLTVEPGSQVVGEIAVRNSGAIVDRLDLTVVGLPPGWAVVEPPSHSLFPGTSAVSRLVVRPPRTSEGRAGLHPIAVRATSGADANKAAEQGASVEITPFADVRPRLTPTSARASAAATFQVLVENRGNADATVTVEARSVDGAADIALEHSVLTVACGGSDTIDVTVRPRQPAPPGHSAVLGFQVVVGGGSGPPTTLEGSLLQESAPAPPPRPEPVAPPPKRRRWVPVVLVLLLLLVAAGVAGALLLNSEDDGERPDRTVIEQPSNTEPSDTEPPDTQPPDTEPSEETSPDATN